jgi:aminopeptidase N
MITIKKLNNTDLENRKIVLNQYETYVNAHNEFPIRAFTHRYNKPSSMIGYSKLAFVFHMLEKKLGEENFNTLIKKFYNEYKFKEANLKEVAQFFNKNTKDDLDEFFAQWLYKKGKINFKIENIKNYYDKDGFWLSFDLKQDEKNFFKFDLPIDIKTYDKKLSKNVLVTKANQNIKLNFQSEVLEFTLDKNYDLFRNLSKKEKFVSISKLLVEKSLIGVINKKDIKKYEKLKKVFPKLKLLTTKEIKFKEMQDNSLIFFDFSNELLKQFYPTINIDKRNSYLAVKPHIYNDNKVMSILNLGEYKSRYLMMLKHFSKYSEILLSKDETKKILDKTVNGIKIKVSKIPAITKVEKRDEIKDIYTQLDDKKIIYLGESHTNFEHHLNQLRVIKSLHKNGKKIAIGMEMFQKPFQKDLDEYIAGKTSLDEFLKNTEYYKRWVYDYSFYKPIIDYAKENKIPLISLNIDREINKQVSKKSILSLNKEQKEIAPKEIDQSNIEYKNSLEKIFQGHGNPHKTKKKIV